MTARNSALTEELTATKQRLDALAAQLEQGQQTPAPRSANPLDGIDSAEDLNRYAGKVKNLYRDVERFQADAMPPQEREAFVGFLKEQKMWDAEEDAPVAGALASFKFQLQDALQEHIPARRDYLAQAAQFDGKATELFPFYKDRTSPEYQSVQQVLKAIPEIRRMPHWKIVAATYVLGMQALEKRVAELTKPAAPAKPRTPAAPRIPAAPASVPAQPAAGADLQALRDKAFKSGNPKDMEAFMKAQLRSGSPIAAAA